MDQSNKIKELKRAVDILLEEVDHKFYCEECTDSASDVESLISIIDSGMCTRCYSKRVDFEPDEMSLAKDYIENKGGQGE